MQLRRNMLFLAILMLLSFPLPASQYDILHLDGGPAPEKEQEKDKENPKNTTLHGLVQTGLIQYPHITAIPVTALGGIRYDNGINDVAVKAGISYFIDLISSRQDSGIYVGTNLYVESRFKPPFYNAFFSVTGLFLKDSNTQFGFDIGNTYSKMDTEFYTKQQPFGFPFISVAFFDKVYGELFLQGKEDSYKIAVSTSSNFDYNKTLIKNGFEAYIHLTGMFSLFSEGNYDYYVFSDKTGESSLIRGAVGIKIVPNKKWLFRLGGGYSGFIPNMKDRETMYHTGAALFESCFSSDDPQLAVRLTAFRSIVETESDVSPVNGVSLRFDIEPVSGLSFYVYSQFLYAEEAYRIMEHALDTSAAVKRWYLHVEPGVSYDFTSYLRLSLLYRYMTMETLEQVKEKRYPGGSYIPEPYERETSNATHTVMLYLSLFN